MDQAATRFRHAVQTGRVCSLVTDDYQVPGIRATEAVTWTYRNGMVNTGRGREIYQQIMAAPPYERCPLCGHGIVRTLDHYMPKSSFPALCVTPDNLVPACGDCNHIKGEKAPASPETTLLHPYFDRIDNVSWLGARVIRETPPRLEFHVKPVGTWTQELTERVRHHFRLFGLAMRYAPPANSLINDIRRRIAALFECGGASLVRDYLHDEADTRLATRRNGWEGVTYRALAEDDWFCSQGFTTC
ncbi:hypothetical protein [Streptomyces specialis]|uniref:hypothetical protein n=1 Tax=Streptomyces specialis TaxID=498367 RepID=UPI00131C4C83|nr:hypothetical protein [Streptomyces specialis]